MINLQIKVEKIYKRKFSPRTNSSFKTKINKPKPKSKLANWLYVMVCDVSRIHTQPWLWLKKSMYPKNFLLKLNWLYVMAVEGNVHSCTSK